MPHAGAHASIESDGNGSAQDGANAAQILQAEARLVAWLGAERREGPALLRALGGALSATLGPFFISNVVPVWEQVELVTRWARVAAGVARQWPGWEAGFAEGAVGRRGSARALRVASLMCGRSDSCGGEGMGGARRCALARGVGVALSEPGRAVSAGGEARSAPCGPSRGRTRRCACPCVCML